jgi:hypothetical protein
MFAEIVRMLKTLLGEHGFRLVLTARRKDLLDAVEQTNVSNRLQVFREGRSKLDGHGRLRRSKANTSARLTVRVFKPSWMARPNPMSASASRNKSGRSLRISSNADLTWRFSTEGRGARNHCATRFARTPCQAQKATRFSLHVTEP